MVVTISPCLNFAAFISSVASSRVAMYSSSPADFEAKDGRLIFREYLGESDFAAELFGHIAAEYIGNSASDAAAAEAAVKLTDIPAPVAEALGFSAAALSERRDFMYRLNTPFTLGGIEIDTPSKLRALLNNAATFKADAY